MILNNNCYSKKNINNGHLEKRSRRWWRLVDKPATTDKIKIPPPNLMQV